MVIVCVIHQVHNTFPLQRIAFHHVETIVSQVVSVHSSIPKFSVMPRRTMKTLEPRVGEILASLWTVSPLSCYCLCIRYANHNKRPL